MWLLYAVGSALFAGLTSILAKCGIRKTDSTVATAIRTIIVLIFAWVMVFVVGSQGSIASIPARSLIFLGLSGLATGASWLCYFYALQRGPIDKVVPIDKSSTVMTILLAALLLGESVTLTRGIGVVLIAVGTFLMIEKKGGVQKEENGWMAAAFGSAIFAALTSILGKVGITEVESNLGTALRTGVVPVVLDPALPAAARAALAEDADPALDVGADPARLLAADEQADLADVPLARPMHYTSGTTGRPKGVTGKLPEGGLDAPNPRTHATRFRARSRRRSVR